MALKIRMPAAGKGGKRKAEAKAEGVHLDTVLNEPFRRQPEA
ncbi:MAG TPA: hypothetical protein VF492_07600 [Verrucomicrobiae bacterium]